MRLRHPHWSWDNCPELHCCKFAEGLLPLSPWRLQTIKAAFCWLFSRHSSSARAIFREKHARRTKFPVQRWSKRRLNEKCQGRGPRKTTGSLKAGHMPKSRFCRDLSNWCNMTLSSELVFYVTILRWKWWCHITMASCPIIKTRTKCFTIFK